MTAIVEPFRGSHDAPLEIEWADDTTTKLFEPLQTTAKIFGTSESGVITATAKDGLYNLYINGQLATTEYLTEQSELFIHSDFLRGEPALIELRDQSGSQIIASSTQMLRRSLTPEDVLYSESKPPYQQTYNPLGTPLSINSQTPRIASPWHRLKDAQPGLGNT